MQSVRTIIILLLLNTGLSDNKFLEVVGEPIVLVNNEDTNICLSEMLCRLLTAT